jgi:hypothetical protein
MSHRTPFATSDSILIVKMSSPYFALSVYSAAVITVPIGIFFLVKSLAEVTFPGSDANVIGAVASVIAVHVVLFAFVYKAFREEKSLARQQEAKKD